MLAIGTTTESENYEGREKLLSSIIGFPGKRSSSAVMQCSVYHCNCKISCQRGFHFPCKKDINNEEIKLKKGNCFQKTVIVTSEISAIDVLKAVKALI